MFPLTKITKTIIKSRFCFWSFWKQKSLISESIEFLHDSCKTFWQKKKALCVFCLSVIHNCQLIWIIYTGRCIGFLWQGFAIRGAKV